MHFFASHAPVQRVVSRPDGTFTVEGGFLVALVRDGTWLIPSTFVGTRAEVDALFAQHDFTIDR
jgi:hypothetical protein